MIHLFAYGTLMKPAVQKEVLGREIITEPDILEGYAKTIIDINGIIYPILIETDGSKVKGRCLDITEEDLPLLDDYETEAYKRIKVKLKSGKKAYTYVMP